MQKPANNTRTNAVRDLAAKFTAIIENYSDVKSIPAIQGARLAVMISDMRGLSISQRWQTAVDNWSNFILANLDSVYWAYYQGAVTFGYATDGLVNKPEGE